MTSRFASGGVYDRQPKSHYYGPNAGLNEGLAELNFKLRIRTAYSIFHAPALGASRLRESRYGRNNRIGT